LFLVNTASLDPLTFFGIDCSIPFPHVHRHIAL
jgi:hypothetical protein